MSRRVITWSAILVITLLIVGKAGPWIYAKSVAEPKFRASLRRCDLTGLRASVLAGVDPNLRVKWDKPTALGLAAQKGDVEAIRLLLDHGALPDAEYGFGTTPIMDAAVSRDVELVSALLRGKPDIRRKDDENRTALHHLCEDPIAAKDVSALPIGKLLVEAGAPLDAKDPFLTPAGRAEVSHASQLAKLLIACGSPNYDRCMEDVAANGLAHAAFFGQIGAVKRLLARDASVRKRWDHGWTPLMCAVMQNQPEIAALLVKRLRQTAPRAINEADEDRLTALHHATSFGVSPMIADLLLRNGADPNVRDREGSTPLHYAVMGENLPLIQRLIAAGADVEAKDALNRTPLSNTGFQWPRTAAAEALRAGGARY